MTPKRTKVYTNSWGSAKTQEHTYTTKMQCSTGVVYKNLAEQRHQRKPTPAHVHMPDYADAVWIRCKRLTTKPALSKTYP